MPLPQRCYSQKEGIAKFSYSEILITNNRQPITDIVEVAMEVRKTGGIGYIAGRWPLDSDKFTLVFIHGAGGSGSLWKSQIEDLTDKANTVALDLPGHNRSDGPGKDRIEDYSEVVNMFVDQLNIPDPILCGHSLGGAIVQQLLMDYPRRYPAGILIGTGTRMKVAPAIFETIENNYTEFVEMITNLARSKNTEPRLAQPVKEDFSKCEPEVVAGDFRACDRFDSASKLSLIEVPVLIVTSEEDKLTPAKYGEFLEQNILNAQRGHIMNAGHIVFLERPDEVNTLIIKFLDTLGS
jgi:pimeloyl-ACP methyl ester carboxylesterase